MGAWGVIFVALAGLAASCGGGGASTTSEAPKTPAVAELPACTTEACEDLSACPLTSKEHLDAFNCRPCGEEAAKDCEDAKACTVRDARSLEALICRAIRQETPCQAATTRALEGWRKDGELPFVDEPILKRAVEERYARQAKAALACTSAR
ncbi:hypothetical protein KEG38_37040 [Polyangium jinanense]|nr:hypothetical protein [Polyangium jinanense]MDC3959519.1 hypothetical protein [Polyangium jinanense]